MAVDPRQIEQREYGIVPLMGGLNTADSKALVMPGTLQDCMNYEVTSRGYDRAQGLFLYYGAIDRAVEDMWYLTGGTISVNDFFLGQRCRWLDSDGDYSQGTVVYWTQSGGSAVLGVSDIDGETPGDTFAALGTLTIQQLADATPAVSSTFSTAPGKLSDAHSTITSFIGNGSSPPGLQTVNDAFTATANSAWDEFRPRPPGINGITGGFQFQDTVYACRDYIGLGFTAATDKPALGSTVVAGSFSGKVAGVVLEDGTWENGDAEGVLFFEPAETASTWDVTSVADGTSIPALGVNAEVDNSRTRHKGQLWKATPKGWAWVDPGYGLRYKEGANAPSAQVAPLFLPDIAGVTTDVRTTPWLVGQSGTSFGEAGLATWTNASAVGADDGVYATCTLPALTSYPTGFSDILQCEVNPNYPKDSQAEILGIQVRIEGLADAGSDVYIKSVRLVNEAPDAPTYISDDLGDDTVIANVDSAYDFGGETELWGMKQIRLSDIANDYLKVQVQFATSGASRTVSIDCIKTRVTYLSRGQAVYFYDTIAGTDVAYGSVYTFETHDGSFASGDATGYMSFYDIKDYSAPTTNGAYRVTAGQEIWTGAGQTGAQIGVTASDMKRNLLPSEAELAEEGSRWETVIANFYQNDDGEAIYGVTGADSAFLFDSDEHFAYIRTPVARHKDKPRHIAVHANHLVLGLKSGHILVSAIDAPNDFDVAFSATAWAFRDPVTGLIPLSGNALGVLCRESIGALVGTQAPDTDATDPFKTQNITPKAGAVEYTVADVMGPMYVDYNGVTTTQTSDKFGDFEAGRMTAAIENWTRSRLQRRSSTDTVTRVPVAGIPVRAKGQYRVYFADGYILSLYVAASEGPPQPMWSHMSPEDLDNKYVPTWIDSSILSTGRERIVMGDKDGYVWVVDGANAIQGPDGHTEIPCWITTNPINTGYPQGAHATKAMVLMGDFYGAQTITTSVGYDYLDVTSTPRTKEVGSYSASPVLEAAPDLTDVYLDSYTDGVSLKIQTAMDGSKPHTLHTLIHRFSRKGSQRNNTQVPR